MMTTTPFGGWPFQCLQCAPANNETAAKRFQRGFHTLAIWLDGPRHSRLELGNVVGARHIWLGPRLAVQWRGKQNGQRTERTHAHRNG